MSLINRTILIEKSRAPLARALAAGLSSGGGGMFETPVYIKATQELNYYVSSGLIDAAFSNALIDANALFTACGGAVTLAQCQDLIATSIAVDCDTESAYETFARLGLTLGG